MKSTDNYPEELRQIAQKYELQIRDDY